MPDAPIPVVVEVTNTLLTPTVTGYQRFVRELLTVLSADGSPALDVLPVVWDSPGACFRRLTAAEAVSLREQPTPRPPAAPDSAPVRLLKAGARTRLGRAAVRRLRPPPASTPEQVALRLPGLPSGAVFFDLEPAWHDPAARAELLPRLRAAGITVVTMVADVMPELYPDWFEPRVAALFHRWLQAHLASSQLCLTISANTEAELRTVAARDGLATPPTRVVPLGADFDTPAAGAPVPLPAGIGRYLLLVGTVEPRKNHALALDLFDSLADAYPDLGLVLVGKPGWLVGPTLDRIRRHRLFGERLLWPAGVSDTDLAWLYEHAFLALTPSLSEGLGLPVLEALHHGVPVISSTGGALPEAGGSFAEYAAPDDLAAWQALVVAHLDDPAHHAAAVARARTYTPPTWAAAGQAVREALADARVAATREVS